VIDNQEQVQIYEVIMHNTDGEVTTTLLRAAGYLKDNRILPLGFELEGIDPDIAPYGEVVEDADFVGGGDSVQYVVDVSEENGPFTVTVELLYQSIGFRWAENLRAYSIEQIDNFIGYYDAMENLPVVVKRASRSVGE
jgi:hypothetical protein